MWEKHNLRGVFLFALLCLSITLIAACTTSTNRDKQTTAAPASQQILRLPIGSTDFTTLDPALVQDGGMSKLSRRFSQGWCSSIIKAT
jgi:ABC-type oligopeptide transport system substrate-binding subunit